MRRRKKDNLVLLLLFLLISMSLGYALIQTDLSINGTSKINATSWNVYFDHVQVTTGSVTLSEGDSLPTIDPTTLTDLTYAVTLKNPGDFYEFTVDVKNTGTLDAMIGEISSKLNNVEITTLPAYMNYSVTYSDETPIALNHLLKKNTTETLKIRISYRTDIEPTDLPAIPTTNTLSFGLSYVQADDNAVAKPVPVPKSCTEFTNDSWETIVTNAQNGIKYEVGCTKEVELGNSLGTHTIRIANTSTPAECSSTGFSQSACGFVLEFADIITTHNMNPAGEYKGVQYDNGWNVDGWPASSMYAYLNDTNEPTSIINSLPEVLRNAIIDTTVISGHGSTSGETNFTSTDKLYLLSYVEVYGSNYQYDTVTLTETRQLDYYAGLGVTTSSYSRTIKKRNGSNDDWWLRSATLDSQSFLYVRRYGDWIAATAYATRGVSTSFRIG